MGNWQVTVRIGEFVFQWRKGDLEVMELNKFLNSDDFEKSADIDCPPSVNTIDDAIEWLNTARQHHWYDMDITTRHDLVTFAVLCSKYQDCKVPFKWEDVLIDGCCIERLTWY